MRRPINIYIYIMSLLLLRGVVAESGSGTGVPAFKIDC